MKATAPFPFFIITIVIGVTPWFMPLEGNSAKFICTLLLVIIGLLIRQDGHQARLVAQWDNPEIHVHAKPDIDVHGLDEAAVERIVRKVVEERS